jgi:hypothetical protein
MPVVRAEAALCIRPDPPPLAPAPWELVRLRMLRYSRALGPHGGDHEKTNHAWDYRWNGSDSHARFGQLAVRKSANRNP